jgi:hypothetical protein
MPNVKRLVEAARKVRQAEQSKTVKRAVRTLSEIYNRWAPDLLAKRHAPSPEENRLLDEQAIEFIREQLVPRKLVPEQDFNALARGPKKTSGEPSTGLIKLLSSMFSEHGGPITDEDMVNNYINARMLVSPEEVAEGLKFYPLARDIAEQLGEYAKREFNRNYDIRQLAAVIASTSPGQGWLRNIADAHKAINAYHNEIAPFALNRFGDLGMKRAYLALAGEPLENLFDPIQSAKIGNFAWTIAGGGKPEEIAKLVPPGWNSQIVADRHVFRVGTGERRVEGIGSSNLYGRFDKAVREAANAIGKKDPNNFQAIIWTGSRTGGVGNKDPKFAKHLFDRTDKEGRRVVNLLKDWLQTRMVESKRK